MESDGGCKQRWVVVNEVGDALRAGPGSPPHGVHEFHEAG